MPFPLGGASRCRYVQMQHDYAGGVLAGDSVPRLAVAINDFLTEEAIALDGVLVPLAARHLVLTEANHADFRAQGFCVLNRAAKVCRFECEHLSASPDCGFRLPPTDREQYYTSV